MGMNPPPPPATKMMNRPTSPPAPPQKGGEPRTRKTAGPRIRSNDDNTLIGFLAGLFFGSF